MKTSLFIFFIFILSCGGDHVRNGITPPITIAYCTDQNAYNQGSRGSCSCFRGYTVSSDGYSCALDSYKTGSTEVSAIQILSDNVTIQVGDSFTYQVNLTGVYGQPVDQSKVIIVWRQEPVSLGTINYQNIFMASGQGQTKVTAYIDNAVSNTVTLTVIKRID